MRSMVQGAGGAAMAKTFTRAANSSTSKMSITLPKKARGKRAVILTYFTASKSQCVFTAYGLSADGELTRLDYFGGSNSYDQYMIPAYNKDTGLITVDGSPSWGCTMAVYY